MSNSIKELKHYEEQQRLLRLADAQDNFMQHYAAMLPDERERDYFRRELIYLIHLAYREAQEPLVKQLTDFVMAHSSPFLVMKKGEE